MRTLTLSDITLLFALSNRFTLRCSGLDTSIKIQLQSLKSLDSSNLSTCNPLLPALLTLIHIWINCFRLVCCSFNAPFVVSIAAVSCCIFCLALDPFSRHNPLSLWYTLWHLQEVLRLDFVRQQWPLRAAGHTKLRTVHHESPSDSDQSVCIIRLLMVITR